MSEISERYRKVAGQFTDRVRLVPDAAWENPAPCDGWVARDVVRHLVEWIPGFFESNAGITLTVGPAPDADPAGAWESLDRAIRGLLDDPAVAAREFELHGERYTVERAVDTFCTDDVLLHTWDLARAAGLDESLDPDEVHRVLDSMRPVDDLLRRSGHFGPKVAVPDDADEQTQLIAFTGRTP